MRAILLPRRPLPRHRQRKFPVADEVWNLAGGEGTPNYQGIVRVMRLRENLRQYVKDTNAETAATGWPMVRAMVLAFPQDPACAGADVEDQFMFGDDWLVSVSTRTTPAHQKPRPEKSKP